VSATHDHDHGPTDFGHAFAIGITLNLAFVAIEAFFGLRTGSLALLADAGHNLGDVAGLVLAWTAAWAGGLKPDRRHTYGWQRATLLAALLNAVLLLVAMGSLGWEAVQRLGVPEAPDNRTVMVVAGVGIAINGITAMLFYRGHRHDLNIRGAFLHMAADALVSLGVVLSAGLALWLGWNWLDPVVAILIAIVIVVSSVGLLRQSVHLLFDGVPESVDLQQVDRLLRSLPGVIDIADLHVWALGTSRVALTAHLVMPDPPADDAFLLDAARQLRERFGIGHATLQIVRAPHSLACLPPG
jgi:cobalt-zinc-cadmium efflux system protein